MIATIPAEFAVCPYCGSPTRRGDTVEIYRRSYGPALLCSQYPECDAFVGCHASTGQPKGSVADAVCRDWRKRAHTAFDRLWQDGTAHWEKRSRPEAYAWLQQALGMLPHECHIGMFEPDQCAKVLRVLDGLPVTGAVYVDSSVDPNGVFVCHMFTDTVDLAPLDALAEGIGHPSEKVAPTGFPHYALTSTQRRAACARLNGAVPLDTRAAFLRVYTPARALWPRPKD